MKWARHPNLRKRPGRASRSPVGHRLYAESEDAGSMVGLQAAELPSNPRPYFRSPRRFLDDLVKGAIALNK